MNITQALIFGLIQGFAEMLPISSSAHLILFPWFFNFPDPGLTFDVALHLGTLFAILGFFWEDWLKIIKDLLLILKTRKIETFEQKMAGFLLLASIPGAIFGVLLDDAAETIFRNPLLIALSLTTLGVLLMYADNINKGKLKLENMTTKKAFGIGLAQALAIIPGVSRSGITITAGLFSGFTRADAAKFSFLMSAPIIAGAALVKVPELAASNFTFSLFAVAFLSAAISAVIAIKFLLNFVKNNNFNIFAFYRFSLAALIIIVYLTRG
jgi:undecaprenyl-diphosphatase